MVELSKTLSHSDAKYKIFPLRKEIRDGFPEGDVDFTGIFKGKKYTFHVVSTKNQIMITQLYHVYDFKEGDTVTFKKIKDKEYEITVSS